MSGEVTSVCVQGVHEGLFISWQDPTTTGPFNYNVSLTPLVLFPPPSILIPYGPSSTIKNGYTSTYTGLIPSTLYNVSITETIHNVTYIYPIAVETLANPATAASMCEQGVTTVDGFAASANAGGEVINAVAEISLKDLSIAGTFSTATADKTQAGLIPTVGVLTALHQTISDVKQISGSLPAGTIYTGTVNAFVTTNLFGASAALKEKVDSPTVDYSRLFASFVALNTSVGTVSEQPIASVTRLLPNSSYKFEIKFNSITPQSLYIITTDDTYDPNNLPSNAIIVENNQAYNNYLHDESGYQNRRENRLLTSGYYRGPVDSSTLTRIRAANGVLLGIPGVPGGMQGSRCCP